MASLKDMRVRIAATKATQKITKAMQMVAASKLRRAQVAAEAARPYAERMTKVLGSIAAAVAGSDSAPRLLAGTGNDKVQLLVVSVRRLSSQLLIVVKEERDALTRPFDESERRISQLREIVSQAEQSLNDLGYLFSGEQQRLSKTFGDHRDVFLKSVRDVAHHELSSALKSLPRTNGPRYRRSAMRAAQDVARNHTMPWLETEKTKGEDRK